MEKRTDLSDEFLESIKEKLEKKRVELSDNLSKLEDETLGEPSKSRSGDISSMPTHSADIATDQYEENQRLNQIERKRQALDQIDEAFEKIEEGTYGICEDCSEPITKERLEAIPYSPLCIDCATEAENQTR